MAWRAFWFAANDKAADVLKGLGGVEELQDYKLNAVETCKNIKAEPERHTFVVVVGVL